MPSKPAASKKLAQTFFGYEKVTGNYFYLFTGMSVQFFVTESDGDTTVESLVEATNTI
jgi:hypothetical protein